MSIVTPSLIYWPNPKVGKPLFNGKVYVGEPDLNPEIEANQKQVTLKLEDGTLVPVGQPIRLTQGGVLEYNGSYAVMTAEGAYSVKALDSKDRLAFYIPNNSGIFNAADISITVNGATTDVQTYLENKEVDDLAGLVAIDTSELPDGAIVGVRDQGPTGFYSLRKVPSHGLTSNNIIVVVDANNYFERYSEGVINASRFGVSADSDISSELTDALATEVELRMNAGVYSLSSPPIFLPRSYLKGRGPAETVVSCDDSFIDYNGGRLDELWVEGVSIEGLGQNDSGGGIAIIKDGDQNSNRETFLRVRIEDFPVGISHSAGWGQSYNQLYVVNCGVGFQTTTSAIESGWAGSGYVMENSYFAGCDVGVRDTNLWGATYINTVIEDCEDSYVQSEGGTTTVMINPWFEDNTNPPQWRRGSIVMGGRGVNFDDVSLFDGRPEDCITYMERSTGIKVFRTFSAPTLHVDGEGLKVLKTHFNTVGWEFIDNDEATAQLLRFQVGGGVTSTSDSSDTTEVALTRLTGKRHRFSSQIPNMPELGVDIRGRTSSTGAGRGITRVVFSSGVYESGGAGSTDYGDRWAVESDGDLLPQDNNAYDIGAPGANEVKDIYTVNAVTVSSDERNKTFTSISDPEILAAKEIKSLLRAYTRNDDAEAKKRFGVGAQSVVTALQNHGLSPDNYNMISKSEDGVYGIRYEELMAFVLMAI